jgi:spermidine/putrescine transport system ATP-binding protein
MSDRVVVMRAGESLQIGAPQDIYNEPVNAFVADFIGESNILPGIMHKDFVVEFAGHVFECVDKGFGEHEDVQVVVRPEDVKVVDYDDGPIDGIVESVTFKGVHYEMTVDSHGFKWLIHSTKSEEVGKVIGMDIFPNDIHIMHAEEE